MGVDTQLVEGRKNSRQLVEGLFEHQLRGLLIAQFSLGLAIFGILAIFPSRWNMLFSFGVCLADACDRSPRQKQNVFHTHKLFMNLCCVRSGASVSFYTRMGLLVAILPTHPRVSEVTYRRADAKRQQDLTGTYAHTVFEKILSTI
jgi:hypothetical protein